MKITCCICAHNPMRSKERAAWFMQALLSSRPFDQVIVCIQGDYDKKIAKMMAPEARVVVPKKHLCAEEAFLFASQHATNDWITVGCDDDYYAPDNVRVLQQSNVQEGNPGVIYFPYYVIKPEEKPVGFGVHWPPPAPFTMEQLVQYNFISTAAVVHKDVLKKTGGWRYRDDEAGDWSLWIRAKREGFPFAYFPLPLYYQRFFSTSGFQQQVARVGIDVITNRVKELANGTK